MALPTGWKKRSGANQYETVITDGEYKYKIYANIQTGQREIYSILPGVLSLTGDVPVATINADGNVTKQTGWNNIAPIKNGQTRLKKIKDLSNVEVNKLVAAEATAEQKNNLKTKKEFSGLGNSQAQPTEAGAQGSGPNATETSTTENSGGFDLSTLGNVLDKFEKNDFTKIQPYLHYPQNIRTSYQDKLIITQIEYVPGRLGEALGGSLLNRESDFNESFASKEKLIGTVTLPMPNNISEENSTGWGKNNLTTIAAGLMGGTANIVGNVMETEFSAAFENFKGLVEKAGSDPISSRLQKYLTANAAASILKFGGIQVDPEAYLTRATGTAINPNLELLFEGPTLRQFGFQFKLIPRSEKEATNIRSIIKFFKKGMAPRRSKDAAEFIMLGTPNVFRLKYVTNGNDTEMGSIGKMKTCALVSCGVNYTPDGFYAAFDDPNVGSQPIAVTLQLGFTELTPIYNDEYDSSLTTVGPENVFNNFDVEVPPKNIIDPKINAFAGDLNVNPFAINLPNIDLFGYGQSGTNIPFSGDPGPSRGGASNAASPTRVFQQGGSTATPANSPNLGGGVKGV